MLARESKLSRRLADLDDAVDSAEAQGLDLEARRLEVDTALREVLRQGGCKRKERELREARDGMRVQQRDLEGFKERAAEEVAEKEARVRELKAKVERAERRQAAMAEMVVKSEVAAAEKERELSAVAEKMELKNAEVVKERGEVRYRKEEVDRKRKQIGLEDMNIERDREMLRKRRDIVSR